MNSIHISTLRKMLRSPEPVTIRYWKRDGSAITLNDCIALRYNFYEGTQQFKLLRNRQIRTLRLCCIFEVNGMEVFL